jgi:starch phosphorylase
MNDYYLAVANTVRDRMQYLFVNSVEALLGKETRVVCCLSAEFLMGPHMATDSRGRNYFPHGQT